MDQFFYYSTQNICCGNSKELSQSDSSFEHPKHMLKLMGKKIYEPRSDNRDLLAIKVKMRYLQRKKYVAVVNKYRKFEAIIFTKTKDMSA